MQIKVHIPSSPSKRSMDYAQTGPANIGGMRLSINPSRSTPPKIASTSGPRSVDLESGDGWDQPQNESKRKVSDPSQADFREGLEHARLYSPGAAIHLPTAGQVDDFERKELLDNSEKGSRINLSSKGAEIGKAEHTQIWEKGKNVLEASKEMAADIRGGLSHMKERLIEKLAAVPVPAESLENARQSIESIVREATHAAYGMTKDAVQRIRIRLVEILPSMSPNETREIVDDVEREVLDMSDAAANLENPSENVQSNRGILPATTSAQPPDQPVTPSIFSANMNRLRSWTFRSRL